MSTRVSELLDATGLNWNVRTEGITTESGIILDGYKAIVRDDTNTALSGLGGQYAGLGLAYGGAVSAYQSANQVNALSALNSAIASQSSNVIGAGAVGGTRTATPTTVV